MDKTSKTIDQLKRMIAIEGKPQAVQIERGMITRFVEAIDDPNPLWQDVAPPMLLTAAMMSGMSILAEIKFLFPRIIDREGEWDFYHPITVGNIITCTTRIIDVRVRRKMLFLDFETTYENQRKELVGKSRGTLVNY